jgi:hypothetical protein
MDNRSARIAELLTKLQAAIGQGDICPPYAPAAGEQPNIEVTIKVASTGADRQV